MGKVQAVERKKWFARVLTPASKPDWFFGNHGSALCLLGYPIGSWTWLRNLANIARMELAEVQNTEAQPHALGDLSRAIPTEGGNIDPFGLYNAGTLATAPGSEDAAEAMLRSTKKACDDLMARHVQVAVEQALAPGINLLRRTVKIVAPVLLALCILGLWLALQ